MTNSFFFLAHQHGYEKQIKMRLFMSMELYLIKLKLTLTQLIMS